MGIAGAIAFTRTTAAEYNKIITVNTGGISLDVQPISADKAMIILTASEASKLGISFQSFEKDNPQTKSFLTCTLAILRESGLFRCSSDSLSVEVYEQSDNGLVIYLSSDRPKPEATSTLIGFYSKTPAFFFENAKFIQESVGDKIISSRLYEINGGYGLMLELDCTKSTARRRLSKLPPNITNRIKAEKIREYGNLLSDSPFNLFI